MRKHNFLASVIAASFVVAFAACQKAPNNNPPLPVRGSDTVTKKPDAVSSTHVATTVFVELGHIERALKPMHGIPTTGLDCRTTETTNRAQWETTWKCGVDPKVRGRKEITGVERLNYDQATRTLSYVARFETRNFEDLEPSERAHTVSTDRTIKVVFDRGSTEAAGRALLTMTGQTVTYSIQGKIVPGSQYESRIQGILVRQGTDWTLTKDARIEFDGALFGLDGDRGTSWASGTFAFVPESNVNLAGLGKSSCTRPIGTWNLSAVGGGKKFDTKVESSEIGGVTIDGSTLGWPQAHCDEP